jgi:predicted nucleic acid-binding protein
VSALDPGSPKYISTVALGEIRFGVALAGNPPALQALVRDLEQFSPLEVSVHTSMEYGTLKEAMARHFLHKLLRRDRPRWLEDWVDRYTGKKLQVDDNDLWMCAQARERSLILLTTDAKMLRISSADPAVRILVIA